MWELGDCGNLSLLEIHAAKSLPGSCAQGPQAGRAREGGIPGETQGTRPQEATQEEARCPQLWEFSGCPPGLGERRKSREGRKVLGESFHRGLSVRLLVRTNTSIAHPPPCPGPQGPRHQHLHRSACAGSAEAPAQVQSPLEGVVRPSHR